MKVDWTPKNVSIAGGLLVSALVVIPNLGKGLEALVYLVKTPETAYAAKQVADTVQNDFGDYLKEQRTYTKALNDYTQQLQKQQMNQMPSNAPPPPPWNFREYDEQTDETWCCDLETREDCFEQQAWYRCD